MRPERSLAVGCVTAALLVVLRDLGLWPGRRDGAGDRRRRWIGPGLARPSRVDVRGPADPFERLMSGRLSAPGRRWCRPRRHGHRRRYLRRGPVLRAPVGRRATLALAGVVLVVGPYAGRLLSEVRSAERERIRTEERAEMAAHLHDSALQTWR